MSETTCGDCGRKRTTEDGDYNPLQAVLMEQLGWYSGSDGEICGSCMGDLMRMANGGSR